MTDEQYIDALFTTEPCGYEKTPGFRAFLLDAMAAIGERPRAGDVSSMHLAYTAGLEHGQEWTDERPIEPGEYWLSLHPSRRHGETPVLSASLERASNRLDLYVDGQYQCLLDDNSKFQAWLVSAKWSRRETPADPFEVTG